MASNLANQLQDAPSCLRREIVQLQPNAMIISNAPLHCDSVEEVVLAGVEATASYRGQFVGKLLLTLVRC